jgi:LysR family transcriptional regulator (chromosome initiation inhibitor)
VRETFGTALDAPTHWVPSTQGFLDATLAGLGWAMNPMPLGKEHLAAGRLMELVPGHHLDVPLHWENARLGARLLDVLTRELALEARRSLMPTA